MPAIILLVQISKGLYSLKLLVPPFALLTVIVFVIVKVMIVIVIVVVVITVIIMLTG